MGGRKVGYSCAAPVASQPRAGVRKSSCVGWRLKPQRGCAVERMGPRPCVEVSKVNVRVSSLHYDAFMTTFADSLKKEIARVARKELREEIAALRKTSLAHRSEIAELKKQLKAVHAQVNRLSKGQGKGQGEKVPAALSAEQKPTAGKTRGKPGRKVVFTAERLKAQRARLGFTQEQMAKLLEVSSLSIWKWESGGASPRASRVPQILDRLGLGKREAESLIAA